MKPSYTIHEVDGIMKASKKNKRKNKSKGVETWERLN
jgi:hypothetical protein